MIGMGGEGVFFRKITTRKNGKEYVYVKLIENYRASGKIKQRVVANFGSIDKLSPNRVSAMIMSLKKLYREVEAQDEKKLDLNPIKTKIPGINSLLQHNQTVQSICKNLNEEQQKLFTAIMVKRMLVPELKEPIQDICNQLGLVKASSIEFYKILKQLGEIDIRNLLLKSTLDYINHKDSASTTIYIHIVKMLFQGSTFEADITGSVYVPENYQRQINLLLACDENSTPLDYTLVESSGELLKEINTMLTRLTSYTQSNIIILDGTGQLDPESLKFAVAQPIDKQQENMLEDKNCYFDSIRLEQKSEDRVKEIRANLAKVTAGLENIKADILLGKLNKESLIRKRTDTVIKANDCQDLVYYHFNELNQSFVYHIKEEAIKEKTYSMITTTWCVPRKKIKAELPKLIKIKTDQFSILTDQLNIAPINIYADYHYSSDVISGHVSLEIIINQLAMVAQIPQQGGEA